MGGGEEGGWNEVLLDSQWVGGWVGGTYLLIVEFDEGKPLGLSVWSGWVGGWVGG